MNRNKGCGDFVEGAIMGKAPLCKGSSCEAGEGLCRFEKLAGKDRARFLDNPSVSLRLPPPFTQGRLMVKPVYG